MKYVDVAVFSPLHGTYTYTWPDSLGTPEAGLRVRIPLGKGWRSGVVMAVHDQTPDYACKPVDDRLEFTPSCTRAYCTWIERASRYYLASFGEFLETAMAWGSADEKRKVRLVDHDALQQVDPELAAIFSSKRAISLKAVRGRHPSPALFYRILKAVEAGGLEACLDTRGEESVATDSVDGKGGLALRPAQLAACRAIADAIHEFKAHLLFGATGSGKTEVYLNVAEKLVAEGRQVLILVPEIGLTPMWLARLKARFTRVGIWHSGMGAPERLNVLHQLNDLDVLIGTRSALFLPLSRLGMVVVDEEHDGSFKQQEGIHYSARDMALLLGQEMGVPVILGSATPSLESWRRVKAGEMALLELPERIQSHGPMQKIIIDMRNVQEVISPRLFAALDTTRQQGQQSILFLNRRGYSPALQCTACGDVPKCHACSLNLTLHRRAGQLRCHACGLVKRVPHTCEVCGEQALMPLGAGTEKLEELLAGRLPDLRFARFDRDVITSNKRLKETLAAFTAGEIDCLIGTQMLVKGHHFPGVTLVGVVNADMGLSLPDFRAGERWWQQMTQVTGRAGRGDHPGRIIIQTHTPEAAWFERIGDDSAREVLDEEIQLRELLSYPPYARWVRLIFSSIHLNKAESAANTMAAHLQRWGKVPFSGPMLCPLERLASRFRVEILLRDSSRKILPWKLAPLLEKIHVPSGVRRKVDVDPIDMM